MTVSSNVNTVIEQIKQKLSIANIDELITTVSQAVYASNLKRIHTDGKNVAGGNIGKYSTEPIYVNPKKSPKKFITGGKVDKKSTFKNGKTRKTKYFANGYKGFRASIGRDANTVNLQLTGSLLANLQLKPITLGAEIGFLSNKKRLIAEGLEDHFNCKIWGVSNEDKTMVKSIINNFIAKVNS